MRTARTVLSFMLVAGAAGCSRVETPAGPVRGAGLLGLRAESSRTSRDPVVTHAPARRAYERIFGEEPWEAAVRERLEQRTSVADRALARFRRSQNERLMELRMEILRLRVEFAVLHGLAEVDLSTLELFLPEKR